MSEREQNASRYEKNNRRSGHTEFYSGFFPHFHRFGFHPGRPEAAVEGNILRLNIGCRGAIEGHVPHLDDFVLQKRHKIGADSP